MRIRFQDTFTQPDPVSLLPAQHQLVECYQQQRQNNWPIIQLVRTPTEQEMEGKWFYDTFRTAFPTLIVSAIIKLTVRLAHTLLHSHFVITDAVQ